MADRELSRLLNDSPSAAGRVTDARNELRIARAANDLENATAALTICWSGKVQDWLLPVRVPP